MKSWAVEQVVRATKARVENGWVCIDLDDGREIRFPVSKNRRLSKGSAKVVKKVEIICNGTGLHWPDLDEDLSVQGILEGRVGQPEQALQEASV